MMAMVIALNGIQHAGFFEGLIGLILDEISRQFHFIMAHDAR
jgi:hypothetical protein